MTINSAESHGYTHAGLPGTGEPVRENQTFIVAAWWTVQRQAEVPIEAATYAEALAEGKRLLVESDFIGDNEELDNSEGPTNLEIWSTDEHGFQDDVVARSLDPHTALDEAAPEMRDALRVVLTLAREGKATLPQQTVEMIEAALALASKVESVDEEPFRCQGCGREESVCSADPCPDVIADRQA